MIYTTGTIAGNGSTITGTGTNFTAAGSLIRVGCTLIAFTNPVQVLQLTAVASATALSVTPAISPAIAAGTKYAILLSDSLSVDGLAQDIAETFGMYQKYMGGFADVMNGSSDVTITINGTPVTVPGQKSLAKKGANSDITSLSGLTTPLSMKQGGHGADTPAGARAALGITDNQLNSIDGKSGGTLSTGSLYTAPTAAGPNNKAGLQSLGVTAVGSIVSRASFGYYGDTGYVGVARGGSSLIQELKLGIDKISGSWVTWSFDYAGNATANNGSWVNSSDERIKTNKQRIVDPLGKMRLMFGYTWDRLDSAPPGQGFIAQEVQKVIPTGVFTGNETQLKDGTIIEDTLSVDVTGVSAALHHEAILALMDKVEELESVISEMKGSQENLHNA